MNNYKLLSILIICNVIGLQAENEEFALGRLKNHLFINYNPMERPGNQNEALLVEVGFELEHFTFDESLAACELVGVLKLYWHDANLKWSPQAYHNLTRLAVNRDAVWLPDMELYNNEAQHFFESHKNGHVLLENTGRLIWMDDVKMGTFCTPSLKDWPNDKHHCKLNLGSWIHHAFLIDAKPVEDETSHKIPTDAELLNSQYKLTNFSIARVETKYNCCVEPYVTLNYFIEFERHTNFISVLHSFICSIVLFNLVALSLPPKRKEKLWLHSISLILVFGHLIYFGNKLSRIGENVPNIVIFHCISLLLITGSLIFSVFSLFILRTQFTRNHLPGIITRVLQNPMVKVLHIETTQQHNMDNTAGHSKFINVKLVEDESNLINSATNRQHWTLFVQLMERLLLIIYICAYIILATFCLT